MIPKIVHYCWFGGKEIPRREREIIDDCKKKLSDYEFIIWTEENFNYQNHLFARQAYENKKFAFVSDVCRMNALYQHGGIYLDTDVKIIKSFDGLLDTKKLIFGMENDCFISTACILSPVSHPFIKEILEIYQNHPFILEDHSLDIRPNTSRISEMLSEKKIGIKRHEKVETEEIIIYPQEYFSPKNYGDKDYEISNDTYCVHLFHGSWVPASMQINNFLAKHLPEQVLTFLKKIKNGSI